MIKQSELNIAADNIEKGTGGIQYQDWVFHKYGISWDDYHSALTSLDAVREIHNYLLPGVRVLELKQNAYMTGWVIFLVVPDGETGFIRGEAEEPELAWLAAILRAKSLLNN